MRVDTVITLDNDVNCLLLDKASYNDENYFLSVILDEAEEPSDEYIVLKEIVENNQYSVERIVDEAILTELIKLFTKSFGEKVDNLPEFDDNKTSNL